MTVITNQAQTWELCTADVEILVSETAVGSISDPVSAADPLFTEDLAWTLPRFRQRFGYVWVSGRAAIDRTTLRFRPREGAETTSPTPLVIRLDEIASVSVESKLFSKVVVLEASTGETIRVRCRGVEGFAEGLRSAAGQLRAASA